MADPLVPLLDLGPPLHAFSNDPAVAGVRGDALTGPGVVGSSQSGSGVSGLSNREHGVRGQNGNGSALHPNVGTGVLGASDNGFGVYGSSATNVGVVGESQTTNGVHGITHSNSVAAILGEGKTAGKFMGNVEFTGVLTGPGGDVEQRLRDLSDRLDAQANAQAETVGFIRGLQNEINGLQAQISGLQAQIH